jgi:hypothetical protein
MRCWANYGVPKLWRYRPWPMNTGEKVILISGFLIIWFYPIIFMFLIKHWILLGGYISLVLVTFILIKKYCCKKCVNLSCPLNGVADSIKEEFLNNNPLIYDSWKN